MEDGLFTWSVAVASLVGVILNIQKNVACFYVWAVTNFCWCVIDIYYGIWAQAVLMGVYFLLALWGIFSWTRKGATIARGEKT